MFEELKQKGPKMSPLRTDTVEEGIIKWIQDVLERGATIRALNPAIKTLVISDVQEDGTQYVSGNLHIEYPPVVMNPDTFEICNNSIGTLEVPK